MPRPHSSDLAFVDAIGANPRSMAFRVLHPHGDEPSQWRLLPLNVTVLSDDGSGGGFYIVAALHVLPSGQIAHCFIDVSFPERINDYSYFLEGGVLRFDYTRRFPGKIIPAIAFDCFGSYELFYSEAEPQVGVDVLKRGLEVAQRKRFIASDLGYILRDEKRHREAADMFEMVVAEEATSYFTFGELAQLYQKLGETELEAKYRALYDRGGRGGA